MQEQRAARELGNQGFETLLPLARVEHRERDGQLVARTRPLFSGYLFVEFDLNLDAWGAILSTRGVKNFVGYQKGRLYPPHVSERDMRELREKLSVCGGVIPLGLNPPKEIVAGMLVTILFGPFRDQAAIVQADCGSRVEVLLRFAGALRTSKLPKDCLALAG